MTHQEGADHKDNIRQIVREGYAKVASRGSSCCGPSASPCCGPSPSETLVRGIGYTEEDLAALREKQDRGKGFNPAIIFRRLSELVPEDAVVSVDVGSSTYSFGRYFECKRQSILM